MSSSGAQADEWGLALLIPGWTVVEGVMTDKLRAVIYVAKGAVQTILDLEELGDIRCHTSEAQEAIFALASALDELNAQTDL